MTKAVFDAVAAGLHDAIAFATREADPSAFRVHVPAEVDVAAIRHKLGMTQAQFSQAVGLTASTMRDWEQRRTRPEGAARVSLCLIERDPDAMRHILREPEAIR